MTELVGQYRDLLLYSNGPKGVVIDSSLNVVVASGTFEIVKLSQSGWEDPYYAGPATELAHSALTTLDVSITAAGKSRLYTIPKTAQEEAKKALEWRKEEKRGGTPVGVNTARTLSKGGQIGIEKVRHIAKYFPRHEVDKKGKGWAPGEDNFPSNGRIAWALWGGDAAWRWARAIVERENKAAIRADGYATPMYEPIYIHPTTELSDFMLAKTEVEEIIPHFIVRLHHDGSGIDRLYKVDLDGRTYMWDDGQWDDLGNPHTNVYDIDKIMDSEAEHYPEVSHFDVDPESAIAIAASLTYRPHQFVGLEDLDLEEATLAANAVYEIDWSFIDSLTAAGEPATNQDGVYTPEERSQKASKQVRDATGKFAKTGTRVTIDGDSSRQGNITAIDPSRGAVTVQMDNGTEVNVPGKSVAPAKTMLPDAEAAPMATATESAPLAAPSSSPPLDTSGILGEPRDSGINPDAVLPGTLPRLTSQDLQQILRDWPAWVQSQRDNYVPTATPQIDVQDKGYRGKGAYGEKLERKTGKEMETTPDYHPLLKNWLKRTSGLGVKNSIWYNPITAAAVNKEPEQELTPKTTDVQPMYMAIVDANDPRAVLKLISLIPASSQSSQPMVYTRKDGKWNRDPQSLAELNSTTPPPVVPLDNETLNDVLKQVDESHGVKKDEEPKPMAASVALAVLLGPSIPVTAAGGLDRNRGNAEELRRYWTIGRGGLKIRWTTPGDWTRCVRNLRKYMGPRAKGYCALRHKEMNGYWPGDKRNRETGIIDDATYLVSEEQVLTAAVLRAERDELVQRISALRAGGQIQTVGDDYNSSTANYFNLDRVEVPESIRVMVEDGDSDQIEEILFMDLIPTQKSVNMRRVGRNYTSDKPVKVWKDDEGYKLIDGHHRCVGNYLNGNDYVKVKVFSAYAEEGAE